MDIKKKLYVGDLGYEGSMISGFILWEEVILLFENCLFTIVRLFSLFFCFFVVFVYGIEVDNI